MEGQTKNLTDYLSPLKRRKKAIAITVLLLLTISATVALLLPSVYRSTATILIEEQEVPSDLVRSTITSYADQRIQVISHRVMTRATLMHIVEKYDLYPRQRKRETSEQTLERLRKDIMLSMINAEVIDRRSGQKTTATIAFTLSYNGQTPESAQKVANELVSLYLNENLKSRQQSTAETSSFLSEETERLSKLIAEIEGNMAAFKAKNMDRLPELFPVNTQLRERAGLELTEIERSLSSLDERKFYLEGQLAQINPNSPLISASGERIHNTDERLKLQQAMLASLSGIYSPDHPDVQKLKREIASLQKESGAATDAQEHAKQLLRLETELAAIKAKYSDDHPEVIKLKRAIASLQEQTRAAVQSTQPSVIKPENPAYITLQAQLQVVSTEIKTLRSKRAQIEKKIVGYEARLMQGPQVERAYLNLNRNHENAVRRYQEIKSKQMEAQVAQELEADRKGERFSLIDPPEFPQTPASPNRPAILLLGLVLSLGGGLGCAAVLEGLDSSVRDVGAIEDLAAAPVLAVIPYIESGQESKHRRKVRRIASAAMVSGAVAALLFVHFLWMPLDVLWFAVMRRLQS